MSSVRQVFLYGIPLLVLFIGLELIIWKDASPSVKVKAMRYHLYILIGQYQVIGIHVVEAVAHD